MVNLCMRLAGVVPVGTDVSHDGLGRQLFVLDPLEWVGTHASERPPERPYRLGAAVTESAESAHSYY